MDARAELGVVLLAAAEITAYGLISMQEAIDGSSHASVRSALTVEHKTMTENMLAVKTALASVEPAVHARAARWQLGWIRLC